MTAYNRRNNKENSSTGPEYEVMNLTLKTSVSRVPEGDDLKTIDNKPKKGGEKIPAKTTVSHAK